MFNTAVRQVLLTVFGLILLLTASADCLSQTASASPTPSGSAPDRFETFRRFVQIDALSVATRYRYVRTANGAVNTGQVQYQVLARGRFKFDRKGRYSVGFGLLTGNVFNAGWNNTGVGAGAVHPDINLRQLYFDAKPVDGVEVQVGGLGFERGEGTEITTYDNDGYIVGERLHVTLPKRLYFDDIAVTRAFLGDALKPNVFRRLHRLDVANYYQLLVRKTVNKAFSFSADYSYDSGSDTLHQGLKFTLPQSGILDTLVFESYERIDPVAGYGFAVTGQRKINKYLTVNGGFARIDRPMLNADRFPPGKRIFAGMLVPLSRDFSMAAVGIEGVGYIAPAIPRTRLEFIVQWNVLATLHRFKIQ